jgi:hypothetical protein
MLAFDFVDGVIARAEFRHQRFVIQNSRSGRGWIIMAGLMLLPAMLVGLGAFVLAFLGLDSTEWAIWENEIVNAVVQVGAAALIVMNLALYFVLMLVAVGLAYNSVSREKVNRTWEVLLLTNVSAREMVWGKWWASLMALWGDHFMLSFLRVGLVGFVVVQTGDGNPIIMLGLAVIVVTFTVLDAAFTVALGIVSAISGLNGTVSGSVVLALRFIGMIAGIAVFVILLALVGNNAFLMAMLISAGLIGGLSLLTFLTLITAQALAVRSGRLSPA